MAEKTYVVRVSRLGNMLNRSAVDKAAMEGRIIPPVVEYVPQGQEVKLDPSADATKRALSSGAIEEPGASEERRKAELQAEIDRLNEQQKAIEAQRKALAGSAS
jgi:hypothetical protein